MKKTFIALFMLVMFAVNVGAQRKTYYCEVEDNGRLWFNFGRSVAVTLWGTEYAPVFVDERGKDYDNIIDVANRMTELGWELKHTYGRGGDDCNTKYYVFCKTADSIEELSKGLVTKEEYKRKNRKK